MTLTELESWFLSVVSIREAFRTVSSKDDHAIHMSWLTKGRIELEKIEREERTVEETKAAKDQFNSALNDIIRDQLRTGRATAKAIVKRIVQSPTMSRLVMQQQEDLLERQLRSEVSVRLSRTKITPHEVEKDMQYHASQPELAFFNIEEFRGVPRTLTYVDPETRQTMHIPYTRSLVAHREYSLAQHEARNMEARKRYQNERSAHLALQPLVKKYGDLPPWDLWQKKARLPKQSNGA